MRYSNIILCAIALGLCACDGKIEGGDTGSKHQSATYKLVIEHINKMGESPWDKNTYDEIVNNQITELKKETEKKSANALAYGTYGKVLVNGATHILSSGCSENAAHTQLSEMMAELDSKGYNDVPGQSELAQLYESHKKAANYAAQRISYSPVTSYRSDYDKAYETREMKTAKEYLADENLKCEELRKKIEAKTKPEYYNDRKIAYCRAIVAKYLECTNPDKREMNAAKNKLNICPYSKQKDAFFKQVQDHYDSLQPKPRITVTRKNSGSAN